MSLGELLQAGSPGRALAKWFLAVGLTFALVSLALTWLARNLTITSPIRLPDQAMKFGSGSDSDFARDLPPADFRLATLDGGVLGPVDYVGQVVAIEFWATWCGPCRLQAEFFDELEQELGGPDGVQFLAIDVNEETATVERFVANNPFSYPVLLDTDGSIGRSYDVVALPTVMILDPEGRISFLRSGLTDAATMRREIRKASSSTVALATR